MENLSKVQVILAKLQVESSSKSPVTWQVPEQVEFQAKEWKQFQTATDFWERQSLHANEG